MRKAIPIGTGYAARGTSRAATVTERRSVSSAPTDVRKATDVSQKDAVDHCFKSCR
jgi:hypothetical protein